MHARFPSYHESKCTYGSVRAYTPSESTLCTHTHTGEVSPGSSDADSVSFQAAMDLPPAAASPDVLHRALCSSLRKNALYLSIVVCAVAKAVHIFASALTCSTCSVAFKFSGSQQLPCIGTVGVFEIRQWVLLPEHTLQFGR